MNADPDKIMESISVEIISNLKAMSKTKNIDEKLKYSEVVKNLSESHGVYLALLSDMVAMDGFPFNEDDDETPF